MRITGGKIITPDGPRRADVRIDGEKIAAVEIAPSTTGGEPVVDADGLWVLPGGVDVHTHFGMPLGGGITSLGWQESSEAALLGGTTTVIDFANPAPDESLAAAIARWQSAAEPACLCDWGLHCTVIDTSPERLAEIPALVAAGLPTFKGFLAYKGRLMLLPEQMRTLMTAVNDAGGMLLVHAEDGEMNAAAEQVLLDTGRSDPHWHPAAHPPESETRAVAEVLDLAQQTGCPLTVVHMSLAESLQTLRRARSAHSDEAAAPPLFGEVCLHHLFATDELYRAGYDAALAAICSPPLRSADNGPDLLAGLAAGDLQVLSTDHCEFPLTVKQRAAADGFPHVPNGCGGVGERLTISYSQAVVPGHLSPWRWLEVVAEKPAKTMGLTGRKGRLHPGYDADIVLFDPEAQHRWSPLGQSDRAGSLWAGLPVTGRVIHVWRRGRQVVADGQIVPAISPGVFLQRRLT